ncbi:e91176de-7c22-4270-b464-15104fc05307 [Thermothielavioides terrestris]|jgi:hypothetical protein|uniref:F-box domain-containing protein n=2 Tax=Thermothielavioides terrestris TaxID=2587410 RepID=G2QUI1_THETT|nr:uncharacterized protein THITE_2110778 [Thermothielavioides terrestris NRRL 8126]AEO64536.1 hypothetical protein THITE_2110778 [Thermothielavioides terrestris NRRL 8126]SPQ26615.1 e91176de-7c22-4270-b464-15104fc05307 [Thermothielavioides terrestris]
MIEVLYSGQASLEGPRSAFDREEHMNKELNLARWGKRPPRRSQTQHEYFLPAPPAFTVSTIRQQAHVIERSPQRQPPSTKEPSEQEADRSRATVRRPPLGPPRRSYSTTDQQPILRRHQPASRLALMDLPAELHFAIFDFLDPIDSTCLGLTNKHFYAIHRRLHGTVPLTTRRKGPNDLEWAWHLAGNIVRKNPAVVDSKDAAAAPLRGLGEKEKSALSTLRVRGQGYCRMCGVTRCQLHKHIQEWMGEGWEYCFVKEKFGPIAPEGAKSYCYMSRPGDKHRCGRHFVRKNKVELR